MSRLCAKQLVSITFLLSLVPGAGLHTLSSSSSTFSVATVWFSLWNSCYGKNANTHPLGAEELHAFGDAIGVLGEILGRDDVAVLAAVAAAVVDRLLGVGVVVQEAAAGRRVRHVEEGLAASAALLPQVGQQLAVLDVLQDQQARICGRVSGTGVCYCFDCDVIRIFLSTDVCLLAFYGQSLLSKHVT